MMRRLTDWLLYDFHRPFPFRVRYMVGGIMFLLKQNVGLYDIYDSDDY